MPGGTGAQSNSRPTKLEQKKQEDKCSPKDIYVSVAFSIVDIEHLVNLYITDEGENSEQQLAVVPADNIVEEGFLDRTDFDCSLFVDCSDVLFPYDDIMDEYRKVMLEKIGMIVPKLKSKLSSLSKGKTKAHLYILSTVGADQLAYALSYICADKNQGKIKDSKLSSSISKTYGKSFKKYKKVNEISIDYFSVVDLALVHAVK